MMNVFRNVKNNKGLSLIEVSITAAVIAIVTVGMGTLFIQNQKHSETMKRYAQAEQVARAISYILFDESRCTAALNGESTKPTGSPPGAASPTINLSLNDPDEAASEFKSLLTRLYVGAHPMSGLVISSLKIIDTVPATTGASSAISTIELKMQLDGTSKAGGFQLPSRTFVVPHTTYASGKINSCLSPDNGANNQAFCSGIGGTWINNKCNLCEAMGGTWNGSSNKCLNLLLEI